MKEYCKNLIGIIIGSVIVGVIWYSSVPLAVTELIHDMHDGNSSYKLLKYWNTYYNQKDRYPVDMNDLESFVRTELMDDFEASGSDVPLSKFFRFVGEDYTVGNIVLIGYRKDTSGMTRAITDKGIIIKIRLESWFEKEEIDQ